MAVTTSLERVPMLRSEVETEFQAWLRSTAKRRGLTQADVAWSFPYQVHPKTVETWFGGRATPRYAEFVGLCHVLQELPPALTELCRDDKSESA